MAFLILGLVGICWLASIVCFVITLIKMFTADVMKGVIGLICGLYALIWSWQNKDQVGPMVPMVWTLAIVLMIVLQIVAVALK